MPSVPFLGLEDEETFAEDATDEGARPNVALLLRLRKARACDRANAWAAEGSSIGESLWKKKIHLFILARGLVEYIYLNFPDQPNMKAFRNGTADEGFTTSASSLTETAILVGVKFGFFKAKGENEAASDHVGKCWNSLEGWAAPTMLPHFTQIMETFYSVAASKDGEIQTTVREFLRGDEIEKCLWTADREGLNYPNWLALSVVNELRDESTPLNKPVHRSALSEKAVDQTAKKLEQDIDDRYAAAGKPSGHQPQFNDPRWYDPRAFLNPPLTNEKHLREASQSRSGGCSIAWVEAELPKDG